LGDDQRVREPGTSPTQLHIGSREVDTFGDKRQVRRNQTSGRGGVADDVSEVADREARIVECGLKSGSCQVRIGISGAWRLVTLVEIPA
jgi:hypothetical protein